MDPSRCHPALALVGLCLALGAAVCFAAEPPEPQLAAPAVRPTAEVLASAPAEAWRPLDPENTLLLELDSGQVILELARWMAPRHVDNIRTLVDAGYFDGSAVLRSQDNYVVQWGDPAEEGDTPRPLGVAAASLAPEWERPIDASLPFTQLGDSDAYAPAVGFTHELPVARDAATGITWLAHCYGMVGVGRDVAPDSGNGSQLYVVIGHAPRHLDRNVTLVGRVVAGIERLSTLPRGSGPLGFYETPEERIPIRSIRRVASLPPEETPALEVLRTDTGTFEDLIRSRRFRTEEWFASPVGAVELCNVPIPVREAVPRTGEVPPPAEAATGCPELAGRLEAIAAALERRPEDATLHYYHAATLAACGDVAGTVAALEKTVELGDGFLPVVDVGFETVADDPAYRAVVQAMADRLPRVTEAEVAFRVEGADWIPEGIAWDERTGRLFMGSMARGTILVLGAAGSQGVFAGAGEGLRSVLGLVVDEPRRRLLAVDSGKIFAAPEGATVAPDAVVALDLETGGVQRRLEAPDGVQLNDVTIARSGTVYASDSGQGIVLSAAADAAALTPMEDLPVLRGANGLALDSRQAALYVAHSTGVARVDLESGEVVPRIPVASRESLGAIDGLYWRQGTLLGVQNVTHPGRVVAALLDEAGERVTEVRTLLSHHHPDLAEPTTGAVAGGRFFVLANSFVFRLQPDGTIEDAESVTPPVILAIPLGED
jgi:peptidylprolyl isomerase